MELMKTLHRRERADWEKVGEGAPRERDLAQLLVTFKMMSVKSGKKNSCLSRRNLELDQTRGFLGGVERRNDLLEVKPD